MKLKLDKTNIIYIILGVLMGIGGRWLCLTHPIIPLYLNFIGPVFTAYYGGALEGLLVAFITVTFGALYTGFVLDIPVYAEISFWISLVFIVVLVGKRVRKYKAFESVYKTFGTYGLTAVIRSILIIPVYILLYDGQTRMTLCDTAYKFMSTYKAGYLLKYIIPPMIAVFLDSFVTFAVIYCLVNLIRLFKKIAAKKKSVNVNGIVSVLVISAIAFGAFSLRAEAEESSGDNFVQTVYDSEDGLLGGAANGIAQTDDGIIWVGTYGGLYRYNGKDFEMIRNIPGARSISSLYVDDDDNLWIASNGTGLVVKTSEDELFTLTDEDGLPSNAIRSVIQINSTEYYVGTVSETAIVKFDGKNLKMVGIIPDVLYVKKLAITPDGYVLATTNSGDVYLIKDGQVTDVFSDEEAINNTLVLSDSEIYMAGADGDLCSVGIISGKFRSLNKKHIDGFDSLKSVLISSGGVMYIAGTNGIGYFDDSDVFCHINTGDFNNSIDRIMEDYQGNIWFTSYRCGLLELSASSFTNLFDTCNVGKEGTNTVKKWKGLLYVGTDNGLIALDENRADSIQNAYTEMFQGKLVRALSVDSQNHLWVSTDKNGLYEVVSANKIYTYTDADGLPSSGVRCTIELTDGDTLVSTYSGLAYISDHKVTKALKINEEMKSAYALCLLEADDGTILAGTNGDGICVIKDGTVEKYVTHKDGLPAGVILNLSKDIYGDGYFVLSGSGLCYMDQEGSVKEFTEFPFYNNTDIFETTDRKVVVLSTAGVYIADYDELMKFGDLNAVLVNEKMGLPGSVTSNARNYMTDSDILYFAGSTGIYKLDCSNYYVSVNSYKINMKSVQIDDGEKSEPSGNVINIPSGSSRVAFNLELLNYTATDPCIRYCLEGVDDGDITVASSELSELDYYNIPSGQHILRVEIVDPDTLDVMEVKRYTVNKISEPYEAFSFRLFFNLSLVLIMLTVVGMIFVIIADVNARKQRTEYEASLSVMEKEKAVALEKALEREEAANRSKSDFLANMSHEIRTPINAIIGMDTMIIRESDQDEIRNYARNIWGASKTLLSLINDILDFSKIESGKMELVLSEYNLGSLINDVIVMIRPKAEGKNLEFNVDVDPDIPVHLYGDEGRIKQVIINVLNNAVKYTEKGSVTLKAGYEKTDEKNVFLTFKVSDTGIGIKEEDIKKLFSPFERIEENRNKNIEGTGLGMSITKNLLALMDSELKVQSVYGQGSDFAFTIVQPVMSEGCIGDIKTYASAQESVSEEREEFHAPDAKILVVDDVEMNLIVFKSLLKRTKVQIDAVDSGAKAIEMAGIKTYDIIFLDAMMPKMSGEETLVHIRQECDKNVSTPVIMLTANAIKGAREEYLEKGFDNYLSKPIDDRELERMIRTYLPEEKIILSAGDTVSAENSPESNADPAELFMQYMSGMEEVDSVKGMDASGGKDTYMTITRNFYETAGMRISLLKELYEKEDIENYTIQVHALKSSARLIGAISLSERALELEMAGKEGNLEVIRSRTEDVIRTYENLYLQLGEFFRSSGEMAQKKEITPKKFRRRIQEIHELLETFDVESARSAFEELRNTYSLPEEYEDILKQIPGEFAEVNRDRLIELLDSILE